MPVPKVYRHGVPTKDAPASAPEPAVHGQALEEMSFDDLYQMAQDRNIRGRSSMTKDDLINALQ